MPRILGAVILCVLAGYGSALGQEFAGVFVPDKGLRIDYLPKKGGFRQDADATSYRYEFIVPASGEVATIRLIPVGERTSVSEDYKAIVVHRSVDMIVLLLVHPTNPKPDKFEVYTLYPQSGIAFSTVTSAYIGIPRMKALAEGNPDVPVSSASMYPLRRVDK